jgi:sialic acid synthase SpsE
VTKELTFGKRVVGAGHPAFVIAEAGVNHNGKLDLAFQLVDAAITARADAVKFQTFIASEVLTAGDGRAGIATRDGQASRAFVR